MKKTKNNDKKINYQYFKNLSLILGTIILFLTMLFSTNGFKNINVKKEIKEYGTEFECMGKTITIKVYSASSDKATRALEEAYNLYQEYDNITTNEYLDKINDKIDPKLYNMIKDGKDWYKKSRGYININSGELLDIWKKEVPKKDELNKIDNDIDNIKLLDDYKIKGKNLNIDLSYIKVGYATKKVEKVLRLLGIDSYIIKTDGLITTGNYYKNNGVYSVSIDSHFKNDNDKIDVELNNQSLAYISLYQNYIKDDNKEYSLIINPITKESSDNFVGITVISDDSSEAYILSHILFMMDLKEGKEYIESYSDVKVIWSCIDKNGNNKNVYSKNYNK